MSPALVLFLLPSLTLANSPGPLPCDEDPKANAALLRAALDAARLAFPGAKAAGECQLFSSSMQVPLAPFDVLEAGVLFHVEPMVMQKNGRWVVVPFADRAGVASAAARFKSEPVVKRVMKDSLHCVAGTDAPGKTPWFRCGPSPLPETSTPSSGHLSGKTTEFEFAQFFDSPKSCSCAEFPLVNYSMPFALLPDDAPGWCTVKSAAAVLAFQKAHPPEQVTVTRWHDYVVRLRAADGTVHEAPLPTSSCYCATPPACPK